MCWWLLPVVVYIASPFDFSLPFNYVLSGLVILITWLVVKGPVVLVSGGKSSPPNKSIKKKRLGVFYYVGLMAPLFLILDLYFFRGLAFGGNVGDNRDLFIDTSPSLIGYLSLISQAFVILNLSQYGNYSGKRKVYCIVPYALTGLILASAGNRQFLMIGLILVVYAAILERPSIEIDLKIVLWSSLFLIVIGTLFLLMQFARQSFAAEDQLAFIVSISKLTCKGEICSTPLAVPLGYLFQYFGNIYQGLNYFMQNDISSPMFSSTVPIFYRRLESIFGLPNALAYFEEIGEALRYNAGGVFPNFWKSMYADIFLDFGYFGLGVFFVAYFLGMTFIIKRVLSIDTEHTKSLFLLLCVYFSTGVMFIQTKETQNLFALIIASILVIFETASTSVRRKIVL